MNAKRAILALPRAAAMMAMSPMERSLLANVSDPPTAPIFIIGPPRSGTTLLYEAMVTRFRLAYFSNMAHRLYKTPVAATRIGAGAIRRWKGDFQSNHGHISGWGSPNEGGWIWKRWISEEHTLHESDIHSQQLENMTLTIAAISRLLDAPFLNKNVMHSVHMRLLDTIFPGCLFIECRREPVATGRSILRARRSEFGEDGLGRWLSVQPPGWDLYVERSPGEQVMAQVMLTRESIARDAEALGGHRHLSVDYEQLCDQPETVLMTINSFLQSQSVKILDRHDLPERFERPTAILLDDALETQLRAAFTKWSGGQSTVPTPVIGATS